MFETAQKRLQTIEIVSVLPQVRKICQTHLLARRPCVHWQVLRMKWLVVGANEAELACDDVHVTTDMCDQQREA